jgi:putative addiction module component (TIGR02574 family)
VPKPVAIPPSGFDQLTVEGQIDCVQLLWERIAATPDQVPVPDWHREVLDERIKDFEANPDAGESWDVVRNRLRDNCASASQYVAPVDRPTARGVGHRSGWVVVRESAHGFGSPISRRDRSTI